VAPEEVIDVPLVKRDETREWERKLSGRKSGYLKNKLFEMILNLKDKSMATEACSPLYPGMS